MEQIIPETISRYMKVKKIITGSQQGFTKGKPCLTYFVSFYDEMSSLVDEGRDADIVHLNFSNAFDNKSRNIFIDKLLMSRLNGQTVK